MTFSSRSTKAEGVQALDLLAFERGLKGEVEVGERLHRGEPRRAHRGDEAAIALVRVSAEGDGAEVPTRRKQSASALAEIGVPEQTLVYEVRRGVSRITGGIA